MKASSRSNSTVRASSLATPALVTSFILFTRLFLNLIMSLKVLRTWYSKLDRGTPVVIAIHGVESIQEEVKRCKLFVRFYHVGVGSY